MTARKTSARETSDSNSQSSYEVGYGKPPRHTQFRKGQSGNPGGRRRREPVDRLKELTLQEAYRGVVIKDRNGIGVPVFAIEAILRSQIELAMNGNARAQREVLNAVRAYERADAQAAALNGYVEFLVQQAANLEEAIAAAKSAASTVEQKIDYVAAARRVAELLGVDKIKHENAGSDTAQSDTAQSEICALATDMGARSGGVLAAGSAETHTGAAHEAKPAATRMPPPHAGELDAEENDAERNTAAPPPSADGAPPPESSTPATSPAASSAPTPVALPADPQPRRPDRHGRHRVRASTAGRARVCARHSSTTNSGATAFRTGQEIQRRSSKRRGQKSRPGAAGGKNPEIPC